MVNPYDYDENALEERPEGAAGGSQEQDVRAASSFHVEVAIALGLPHQASRLEIVDAVETLRSADDVAFEAGRQFGRNEGYEEGGQLVRQLWRFFRPGDLSGGCAQDLLANLPRWLEERAGARLLPSDPAEARPVPPRPKGVAK